MSAPPLLVVAHPGHELMVFGWMEEARPRVFILTDGSGRTDKSRIGSTRKVLDLAQAEPGNIFAAMSDRAFYDSVLDGRIDVFTSLALRVAEEIIATRPPFVAGDAREGYNPTHDICRMIIDAAVRRARRSGIDIANFAFFLRTPHDRCPEPLRNDAIVRNLDDEQFNRKLAAVAGYPELAIEAEAVFSGTSRKLFEQHGDLAAVIDAQIAGTTRDSFKFECLMRAELMPASDERPFYELYGERLVESGTYQRAIRYREHVLPIEQALREL